jgi:hypothetical protein
VPVLVLLAGSGCATLGGQGQPLVPTRYRTDTGPYAVYSNFPIAADAPAIRCLHALETDVGDTLGVRVPSGAPPVEVYILNDRESFNHFLKFYFPELPPRRAFFMAQEQRRVVYTYLGERLEEDLRHEAAHALLNAAVGDLPLWLDEGLAEYFEGPNARQGLNPEHMGRLPQDVASGWKPDLARLETLKSVREMSPRDYRESWAWVHYLLNGPPAGKALLVAYLEELRTNPEARPLSGRLPAGEPAPPVSLLAHVEQVRALPVAKAPADSGSTVRLQDQTTEASRSAGTQRSFFARLRAWVGL